MSEPRLLSGSEPVTQIGVRRRKPHTGFRARPRAHEKALSLLLGEWDADLAVREAFGREPRPDDSVRCTTAKALSFAGFRVIHDKDPYLAHVSVEFEGEWTEEIEARFHACFDEQGAADG